MFKRIDHIELLTAAPERVIAFYVGVLGFREYDRRRISETPSGPLDLVYLELGGTTIEVMCYPETKSIPPRDAERRLGWQCLALDGWRARHSRGEGGARDVGAGEAGGLCPCGDTRSGR